MTPIARWLRDTRLRQTNPDTGRPWSQEYLVARITAETGWKLYRPNYVQYENGSQTPNPETLARFVDFWSRHDEPAPDLTPVEEPIPARERSVTALELSASALERMADNDTLAQLLIEQRETNRLLAARLDAVESLVVTLAGLIRPASAVDQEAVAQSLDAARRAQESAQQREPSPLPQGGEPQPDRA